MGWSNHKGRPSVLDSQYVTDKILSFWKNKDEILSFGEIHRKLVEEGITTKENRMKTTRILKRLVEKGLIEKTKDGYKINVEPKPFDIFSFIHKLRTKYPTYSWGIRGYAHGEGVLLGVPERFFNVFEIPEWTYIPERFAMLLKKEEDEKTFLRRILWLFLIRIQSLFNAVQQIVKMVEPCETRSKVITDDEEVNQLIKTVESGEIYMPDEVLREFMLELLPYYLGHLAGCDGDGLNEENLYKLLEKIIEKMPIKVSPQDPTLKEIMSLELKKLKPLLSKTVSMLRYEFITDRAKPNYYDFAMILIPPSHLAEKEKYDEQYLYYVLSSVAEIDKNPIVIAGELLSFGIGRPKELVINILKRYGKWLLGEEVVKKAMEIYEDACLALTFIETLFSYLDLREFLDKVKNGKINKKEISENEEVKVIMLTPLEKHYENIKKRKKLLQDIIKERGVNELIKKLPLIEWVDEIIPTHKEQLKGEKLFNELFKLLQELNIPMTRKEIKNLWFEGLDEVRKIMEIWKKYEERKREEFFKKL